MDKQVKSLMSFHYSFVQQANDKLRDADRIQAAINRGTKWKFVDDIRLKSGRTYVIRRVHTLKNKVIHSDHPVVATWLRKWNLIIGTLAPAHVRLDDTTVIMPGIEVWVK